MAFNRDTYFGYVRDVLFEGALSQQQVDGQNVILGLWEGGQTGTPMDDNRWLAYMLATTFHETAYKMWPVTEYGSQDYLEGKEYYPFIGRGYVQLTWEENYRNASAALGLIDDRDLVDNPDLALDSLVAARVMFRGMAEGWYTSRKLGQYFNETEDDPVGAREIINGHDQDTVIAAYHKQFLQALEESEEEPKPAPGDGMLTISLDGLPEDYDVRLVVNGKAV